MAEFEDNESGMRAVRQRPLQTQVECSEIVLTDIRVPFGRTVLIDGRMDIGRDSARLLATFIVAGFAFLFALIAGVLGIE